MEQVPAIAVYGVPETGFRSLDCSFKPDPGICRRGLRSTTLTPFADLTDGPLARSRSSLPHSPGLVRALLVKSALAGA